MTVYQMSEKVATVQDFTGQKVARKPQHSGVNHPDWLHNLDAKQIPFLVLDDEIDFPPVLVPVLADPPLVKTSIAKTWSKSQLGFGPKALKMPVQTETKVLKI